MSHLKLWTGEECTCCQNKTVGAHSFTLIHNYTGPIPSNCKNNCTYERNDQDGSCYCFAVGDNQVQCQPHSELGGYPDVHLRNDYNSTVNGTVHYATFLCPDDDFSVALGHTFKHSRGLCLITGITGHDSHNDCTSYTSSGTSYWKFAFITAQNGGYSIIRVVN